VPGADPSDDGNLGSPGIVNATLPTKATSSASALWRTSPMRIRRRWPPRRRTAVADTTLAGTPIRRGDKEVAGYVSGNCDDTVIEHADRFIIDRARPLQHLSFGFGIHRCSALQRSR